MATKNYIATGKNKFTQGKIIAYSSAVSAGVISSLDGKKYLFSGREWKNQNPPASNMKVAFEADFQSALNVSAA